MSLLASSHASRRAPSIAVSPSSPIGQRWLRAEVGDEVSLGGVAWTLIAVR